MKRICVFCGSSPGGRSEYSAAAESMGHLLAERDIGLVYGGGKVGLMGLIAKAVLKNGGKVTGVIPEALAKKEVAFTALEDLRIVASMHERKALMAELADGFIALPGGIGTLEELIEVMTWAQLEIHQKPCGLLNICQFYDPLIKFLDHTVEEKFMRREHHSMLLVDENPEGLLKKFETYQPQKVDKAAWALSLENT